MSEPASIHLVGEPPAPPASAHEAAVRSFIGSVPGVSSSGRVCLEVGDTLVQVVACSRTRAGREVGPLPTWARFHRRDLDRDALFIVSNPDPCGNAELLVIADRGVLCRSLLVDAAKWMFFALGLTKIVAYIPTDRDDLRHLAQRAGLRHEGTSIGHFRGQSDAARWSMLASDCRWLKPRPLTSAQQATPLLSLVPSSSKVH